MILLTKLMFEKKVLANFYDLFHTKALDELLDFIRKLLNSVVIEEKPHIGIYKYM